MSKLNKDILFMIFNELFHDYDYNSLFSCLLVNRYWCETAVPILWRNPWRYQMKEYQKKSLFNIIVSFISEESKEFLTSVLPPSTYDIPSFDYLTYCRSIINYNLYDMINDYIIEALMDDYDRYIIQEEIYKLLINKCPPLKYMDITFIQHQFY